MPTVQCERCQGQGSTGGERCRACGGRGRGLLLGDSLVYWDKTLTRAEFLADRLKSATRTVVRFVFFIVAFAGVMLVVLDALVAVADGRPAPFRLAFQTGPRSLFFWWSVLAGLYVYASLDRDIARLAKIPRRVYQIAPPVAAVEVDFTRYPQLNVYDRLTIECREALVRAWRLAERRPAPFQPAYLFLVLLRDRSVRTLLARLGVSASDIGAKMIRQLAVVGPSYRPPAIADVFLQAYGQAYAERRFYVDMLSVFAAVSALDPLSAEVLYDANVDSVKVQNVMAWQRMDERLRHSWRRFRARARLRPHHRLDRAMTAIATPILDHFSEDTTELAQWGYFLPNVARPAVTEQLLRVLEGGRGAMLVGYPGVGKRGVIEDIAERMVANDVPAVLQDKRLVTVSVPKLISGTTPAGAEGRLLELLREVAVARNIVLVIEDIEGMIGITSGLTAESADLAGVLARSLSGRVSLCLATTTPDHYRRFAQSSALTSVFTRVDLPEPTINESIQIVEARVSPVEYHHRTYFSYDAIARLVELAAKYIPDRHLPQKALAYLNELALFVKQRRGTGAIITASDVDDFIAERLDLPVGRIGQDESARLLHLEDIIHRRLVGQSEAVVAVAEALRRARAEIGDKKRPVANLLFLGPTGVGKTELAKALAEAYFGNETHMVRLDMTEYSESSTLGRLIGDPDGKSSGILTEAIRARPFSLLLLDEIEKAHPNVVNVFMQVMDDGRLTDSRGSTIDFTNVILIATSNAGSDFIEASLRTGMGMAEIERTLVSRELRQNFRPEFLNRFDGVVVFKPLEPDEVLAITRLLLQQLSGRLAEQGITLAASAEAVKELAARGFDPAFGARPLRRVIQDRVDSVIARYILEGRLQRRDTITMEAGGRFSITKGRTI